MVSLTNINKFKTNTALQFKLTIPKEIVDRFKLKGNEKIFWKIKGGKIELEVIKSG